MYLTLRNGIPSGIRPFDYLTYANKSGVGSTNKIYKRLALESLNIQVLKNENRRFIGALKFRN